MRIFLFTVTALLALPLLALDIVLPDKPHHYEKIAAEELLDQKPRSIRAHNRQ